MRAVPVTPNIRGIRSWIAIVGVLALTGCAHWTKSEGFDGRQYRLDSYACAREAGLFGLAIGIRQSEAFFDQCMTARGYSRTSS